MTASSCELYQMASSTSAQLPAVHCPCLQPLSCLVTDSDAADQNHSLLSNSAYQLPAIKSLHLSLKLLVSMATTTNSIVVCRYARRCCLVILCQSLSCNTLNNTLTCVPGCKCHYCAGSFEKFSSKFHLNIEDSLLDQLLYKWAEPTIPIESCSHGMHAIHANIPALQSRQHPFDIAKYHCASTVYRLLWLVLPQYSCSDFFCILQVMIVKRLVSQRRQA